MTSQTPRRRIKRLFQIKEKVKQELKLLFSFLLKIVPKTAETLLSLLHISIYINKIINNTEVYSRQDLVHGQKAKVQGYSMKAEVTSILLCRTPLANTEW